MIQETKIAQLWYRRKIFQLGLFQETKTLFNYHYFIHD